MELLKLYEKELIDPATDSNYAFISNIESTMGRHSHDFFEIFLVTRGNVIHVVNDARQYLDEGSLVFIRPEDIHYYQRGSSREYQFINLAFPKRVFDTLLAYVDDQMLFKKLMTPALPPCAVLTGPEMERAKSNLENLSTLSFAAKRKIKTELRIILLEFLTRYFASEPGLDNISVPEWLNKLASEMIKKENMAMGLPRLQKLSGKTKEHLCRVFMKYFAKTPTEYVNDLRLNYAANMLVSSDMSILDISADCGFENLSYFYEVFKRHFGTTPYKFRKSSEKSAWRRK